MASQRLKDEAEFSEVPKAFFPSVSPNLLEQKVVFFSFLFQCLFEIKKKKESTQAGEQEGPRLPAGQRRPWFCREG